MELNKAACEAATGAFINRLTDKPATSDLLAALRFALEAYESVRVAPAPAGQQGASGEVLEDELIYSLAGATGMYCDSYTINPGDACRRFARTIESEAVRRCRAQRTDNPS